MTKRTLIAIDPRHDWFLAKSAEKRDALVNELLSDYIARIRASAPPPPRSIYVGSPQQDMFEEDRDAHRS